MDTSGTRSKNYSDIRSQHGEIQKALSNKLKESRQLFPESFSKSIYALTTMDDNVEARLELLLKQESNDHTGERIILIPYHLENSYWIGILIEFGSDGHIMRAEYIDSVNEPCSIPNGLKNQFANIYQGDILLPVPPQNRSNQINSVESTVDNLLLAANVKLPKVIDSSKKDEIELTSTTHNSKKGNECTLLEREESLNSGFGKSKIKDESLLSTETKETAKQFNENDEETYEDNEEGTYDYDEEKMYTPTPMAEPSIRIPNLTTMSSFAEKTITEFLKSFEQELLQDCTSSIIGQLTDSLLENLQVQLNRQNLMSAEIRVNLQNLQIAVKENKYLNITRILREVLKSIRPLNVRELKQLIAKAKEAAESISKKDIVLLVGETGSGKSTTIQFLAGSKMKKTQVEIAPGKFIDHITVDGPITNDELINVISSPLSKSETRYISPVTIQLSEVLGARETGSITLCDAPGFEDTAGPEVDIANSIGIIEAIKGSQSVKLLALSSYKSLGDRGQGIQKLAHILINMIDKIEDRLDPIIYAFTKYPEDTDINALLTNIKVSRVNADSSLQSDTTFVAVLDDMIEKTEVKVYKIDPLVQGDHKSLLKKLKNAQGIKNPGKVFRSSISKETRSVIAEHVQRDVQNINNAAEHEDLNLILYYLDDLKILQDLVQQNLVGDAYEKSKRFVIEHINKYCGGIEQKFNRAFSSHDGLNENDVLEYKATVEYLEQAKILSEHLESDLLLPTKLMENIVTEIQKRNYIVHKIDLYNPSVKIYLDNLCLLKNSFKELENNYSISCKELEKRFEQLTDPMHEYFLTNKFDEIAKVILQISKCSPVLRNHLGEQVDRNYREAIQLLIRHLLSYVEKVNNILAKRQISKNDVKNLQQSIEILKSAKDNLALQDRILTYIHMSKNKTDVLVPHNLEHVTTDNFKDLNEIYNELFIRVRKYFDQINIKVKDLFEKNQDDVLDEVQMLIDEMDTIRTIPELESKTTDIYYNIVDSIRSHMQQVQKNAEQLLEAIKKPSEKTNYKLLARSLSRIKNAKWINRVSTSTYENLMYRITEDLVDYAQQLEHRLKKLDLTLKSSENINEADEIIQKIESMSVLEASVPELKKNWITINQQFLNPIQRVFSHIYNIFNLPDKPMKRINQHLKQLEKNKREYDRLHLAYQYLQKQNYLDIDALNREIEDLKTSNDIENTAEDEEQRKTEIQLHNLESVIEKYMLLEENNMEANSYLKNEKYSSIDAIHEAVHKTKKSLEETERTVENKRTKRINSISQRELIKKEYESILSKTDINSLETIEETTVTSESEKVEQKFDDTDMLDVSVANDALNYISQCKKVNDRIVNELAVYTDEKLKKYICEYGNVLNQKLNESFKGVTDSIENKNSDKDKELLKNAQTLEKYSNELLSFTKFPLVSDCIDGTKKIRIHAKEYTKYYRTLCANTEYYKTSENHPALEKQLYIAKVLSFLDDFSVDTSKKIEFGALYDQYHGEFTKGSRETYDIVKNYVLEGEYARADIELSEIYKGSVDQKKLSLLACEVQRSLGVLIKETKRTLSGLDGKFNKEENNESQMGDIIKNIERMRTILESKSFIELLDKNTKDRLNRCEQETIKMLSDIITKTLTYIDVCLTNNNFYEAEQTMDNISRLQRELTDHSIADSTTEKTEVVRKRLENIHEEISKLHKDTGVTNYSKNPPSSILANLKIAADKGHAKYDQVHTLMLNEVRTTFQLEIEKLRAIPWYERSGNINSLRSILKFLPDNLQASMEGEISEINKLTIDEIIKYERELNEALRDAEENDKAIAKLGTLIQKYTTQNMKEFCSALSETVLARLDQYHVELEKSLYERNMLLSVSAVRKIFQYKETVGIHMPEVKTKCNYAYELITNDFSQCFVTLGAISSMGETQITESALSNIIFYIDLFHKNDTKIEDILSENVLQGGRSEFQKMFEYLNENSTKYQNAAASMNVTELHKALTIAKKWEPLLQKIKEKRLDDHLLKALLESIPNITSHADMIVHLETEINRLKTQLNVELISDETTRFEGQRDKFFRNLMNDINLFRQIQSKFNDTLSLKSDLEKIEDDLRRKVNIITSQLFHYAEKEELHISDCDYFRTYYNHLLSFHENVVLSGVDVNYSLQACKENIFQTIRNLIKKNLASSMKVQSVASLLISLKSLAENLSMFDTEINREIDDVLKSFKSDMGDSRIVQLTMILEKSDVGTRLISEHSCLSGEDWRKRREKMQNQDNVTLIVEKLEGNDLDKDNISECYDRFKVKYEELLIENLASVDETSKKQLNLEKLIKNTCRYTENIKCKNDSLTWGNDFQEAIPELLAHIFAVWTLKNTQHYNQLRGIGNERSYLLMPHVAQVIAVFRLLGIGYDARKKVLGYRVPLSGVLSNFFSKYLINNIVEIGTGEGKSVVLAVTACLFALNGIDVYCSCYSEVLSTRDKKDFASVFQALGIEQHIQYGTFNQLCEHVLNEQCNVREEVHEMISTNKCSLPTVNKAKWVRPKILLIDEVDVFLSDKYYGGIYTPAVHLKDPLIKALLDAIWQKKTLRSLQSVKSLPEYQTCASQYSNWALLLDEAIKDMLAALSSYQSSTYIVQNDKIVYVEGESIVHNVVRGYDTIWAYYYEHENGKISQKSLEYNLGIIINCGTFSYAEMPHDFAYIVGVSGTLKTLSKKQKEILGEVYQINKTTYMPSVFGKSNRNYNPKSDVCAVEESEYFMRIRGEIDVMCDAKRAILVFFESEEKLMVFYNSSELSSIKSDVQIISEKVSVKDRELAIKRAATVGTVTLITGTFGRGTDFLCRNPQLLGNGGMHVLQTFFSEELSEEYQIMGRGARQGDRGSYRMILLDKDLEWVLGAAWQVKLPKISGNSLYDALHKARTTVYESKYGIKDEGIKQCKREHEASKGFMNALITEGFEKVQTFLIEQNKGSDLAPLFSRTVLLLDGTGSMSNLLSAAKETICTMFERASSVLLEKGLPNNAIQMQFVVYRDYDGKEEGILQSSAWETKPTNLRNFMTSIVAKGGDDYEEAIEIGLWHAVQQSEQPEGISQVILIGDAPAKDIPAIKRDRQAYGGEAYWSKTKYKTPTHYTEELQRLKDKNIPVHAFYLHNGAQVNFKRIASETSGRCEKLNIHSTQGAETLTHFVTEEVLRKTAGDQGEAAVKLYRDKFVHL